MELTSLCPELGMPLNNGVETLVPKPLKFYVPTCLLVFPLEAFHRTCLTLSSWRGLVRNLSSRHGLWWLISACPGEGVGTPMETSSIIMLYFFFPFSIEKFLIRAHNNRLYYNNVTRVFRCLCSYPTPKSFFNPLMLPTGPFPPQNLFLFIFIKPAICGSNYLQFWVLRVPKKNL